MQRSSYLNSINGFEPMFLKIGLDGALGDKSNPDEMTFSWKFIIKIFISVQKIGLRHQPNQKIPYKTSN